LAKAYIKLYFDLLDALEPFGDAERGRLLTALLVYGKTGVAPELGGNERFLFPMLRAQIGRDEISYQEQCEINEKNGKKGGAPKGNRNAEKNNRKQPKQPKTSQEEDKDKEAKTLLNPPEEGTPIDQSELSDAVKTKLCDWLAYKDEKRQAYKPTGLKSLITQISNNCDKYGDQAVIDCIDLAMGNNWQGIVWDQCSRKREHSSSKTNGQGRESFVDIVARMQKEGKT